MKKFNKTSNLPSFFANELDTNLLSKTLGGEGYTSSSRSSTFCSGNDTDSRRTDSDAPSVETAPSDKASL